MKDELPVISYAAHEGEMTRMFDVIKRLIIAVVITVILLVASNALWLYAWMQYDYSTDATTTETVTVDGKDGIANYIGNDGEINNGKNSGAASDNKNTDKSADKGE